MSMTQELLKARTSLENNLRELLGIPVFLIEMDAFALPCGCGGVTINTRGLQLDDLEIFEEHILKYLTDTVTSLEIEPSFLFARLIPGTAEVASINARILCSSCYMDFGRGSGKQPRPDIYIMRFDRRE
ncbi:DUF5402 family protein [Methanococcoides methylutens]|uniref:Putative metal-binding protein n=1 Tax=Methanococcoides methylutens MM1 TaxID=1434104 RepID=A0A0E3X279_METMT|nr:DUF5402 family protein [Methanococcoides methylutens]AKB86034.1 putative metal-binding protein [Methanococcoides methylutens MM1]